MTASMSITNHVINYANRLGYNRVKIGKLGDGSLFMRFMSTAQELPTVSFYNDFADEDGRILARFSTAGTELDADHAEEYLDQIRAACRLVTFLKAYFVSDFIGGEE